MDVFKFRDGRVHVRILVGKGLTVRSHLHLTYEYIVLFNELFYNECQKGPLSTQRGYRETASDNCFCYCQLVIANHVGHVFC